MMGEEELSFQARLLIKMETMCESLPEIKDVLEECKEELKEIKELLKT